MANQQTPPELIELKLSSALKEAVNTALARGRMLSVAYVSPEGLPELSFRGRVPGYGGPALAIRARTPSATPRGKAGAAVAQAVFAKPSRADIPTSACFTASSERSLKPS